MLSGCPLTFEMKVWVDSCRCLKPSLQKERPPGAELTERKETHRDTLHGPASGQELRGNLKGSWQDSIQGRGRRALLQKSPVLCSASEHLFVDGMLPHSWSVNTAN